MLRLKERYDGYALTDDYFLVFWDQRGTGLSRRHDCDVYNLTEADADLDALVEHVSPGRPVILLGHSWGGMNDDAWDSQFLTSDDQARADYHRMLGVRDSQPKYHLSTQDPAPVWRLGAVANRCLTNSALKNGKGAYDFTDHLSAYTRRVLFIALTSDSNSLRCFNGMHPLSM